MLTLPSLNKRICEKYQNVCLFRGEGYFYFVYDDGAKYFDKSVPVYRVNHLSLDRWLAEAEDFVNGLRQEGLVP